MRKIPQRIRNRSHRTEDKSGSKTTEQRGSALAGPGAPGGRAPGPGPARAATPGLSIKNLVVVGVLLAQVLLEPATSLRAYPPAAPRKRGLDPFEGWCPAGYYRADDTGACKECQQGVDYTNHSNNLPSCIACSVCRDDEEMKTPCITTRDAECQCKEGTFRDQKSPEFCQKCSSSCPIGMVEENPCVPWSDLKCVQKKSGTKAMRETPASAEPVTANLNTIASPHPPSDHTLVIVVGVILLVILTAAAVALWKFLGWNRILACVKDIHPSHGQDAQPMNTVSSSRGSEAQDNDHNEILSSRNSPCTLDLEQQMDGQELVTCITEECPAEVTSLLTPAERSSNRRRPLIPADGTDTAETLRQFFNCQWNIIPYKSWDRLMRQMGLTDNEICVIKYNTQHLGDTLYKMMVEWLNKMGRDASINTLLDALETLGERNAREKIEDDMVTSGKFIYQEDETNYN